MNSRERMIIMTLFVVMSDNAFDTLDSLNSLLSSSSWGTSTYYNYPSGFFTGN
jgi:hypothetical protein